VLVGGGSHIVADGTPHQGNIIMNLRQHPLLKLSIDLLIEVGAENIRYRHGGKHIVLSADHRGRQINTILSKSPRSGDWRLIYNHLAQLKRQLRAETNGA
jgi:hypothetical protein